MAKISSYPNISNPTLTDRVIGTDGADNDATKNFAVGAMLGLSNDPNVLTNFVPYIGANQDLDLGTNFIFAEESYSDKYYEGGEKCFAYGQFYSTLTQQHTSVGTGLNIQFPASAIPAVGVYITSLEKINFDYAGVYMIELKARVEHQSGGGDALLSFWMQKFATNVPFSRQVFTVANTHIEEITYSMLVRVAANDSMNILWSTDNLNTKLIPTVAGGPYPASPSAIVNVYKVGYQ
jgi:hypothetical protein